MTNWQDTREWLECASKIGELKIIKGADPRLEISAIAQINAKNNGPALLFEDIKGYESSGFRIMTNSVGNTPLFNMTFGQDIEMSLRETIETLRGKPNYWTEASRNYPVNFVSTGKVLENVKRKEEIDLLKFPAPLWHKEDGGLFIGTGIAVITKDPDDGKINVGSYRAQLYDKNTVGINIERGKHGSMHMAKYFSRNQPMPIVLVIGPDPLLYVLAGSEIPTGISELEYQGAIMEKAVDVIRGETTGLPIPANCEIALEGYVYPDRTKLEGPHGEWTGYYASEPKEKPYVEVQTLYYRNGAIILGSAMSKGSYNDHAFWRSIWRSALIYDEMAKNGIPNVVGVYTPPFGGGRQFINVSIKQSYPGHATEAGYFASQTRSAAYMGKWVVVVDDDIDPYDMEDVLWAITSRADPADLGIIRKAWASGVDPLKPRDVPASSYTNNRGIIFAVKPYERIDEFPRTCFPTKQEFKETFDKWRDEFRGVWKSM
ncbi:MAG: UbiD family decarboxylase [Methanomassiliicoccales archaeon]